MKKTTGKRMIALLCCAALAWSLCLSGSMAVYGDEKTDLKDQISNLQAQIDAKRQEMNDIQKEIDAVKNKTASEQQQKKLLDQRNAALQQEINLISQQMSATTASIEQTEQLEAEQQALFEKQVRMEEERGTVSYWSVLFSATSFADLVSRIDFVNEIIEYDNSVISELQATREKLAAEKDQLQQQDDKLGASQNELEIKISESMKLLSEYNKTQAGKQAEYDAIKAEEAALDGLMDEAEKKAYELGMSDIVATLGGYAWPCSSIRWITSMFGGRNSPGGIGSTNHKGVDIGTPMGTPILAAKAGKVTWASWNGGYGNCVIVSHGNGNSTLYGHLSSYNCSVGDVVSQGQVIAYSGNTGNSTGPHLHFGIQENNSWIDPLNYLTGWHYYG